jgi:hypothetical protein
MDLGWILKYAGCEPGTGCMGPDLQWWLFGAPLWLYPYMIAIALLFSPLISFIIYHVNGVVRKKKLESWSLKSNSKNVLIIFLIMMILQIAFLNWFGSNVVY